MWGLSYWTIPLFSSLTWLAMLLAMFLHWITQGKPQYESMSPSQHIAYISDVGATSFKPLFIAMGTITVVTFDIGFIAERWLRHKGRLAPNTSWFQKLLSILTILAAIAGAVGLICLTIFDTLRHNRMHNTFLAVFIIGYVISAIFVVWEYQRLGKHFREHRILRISFWIKLTFILLEVALAIAFGVCSRLKRYNNAAILEWVVALVFTFYVFSFFIDFIPAVHSKHHQSRETSEMAVYNNAENGLPMTDDSSATRYGPSVNGNGAAYGGHHSKSESPYGSNGVVNGNGTFTNGAANGYTPPRRNF